MADAFTVEFGLGGELRRARGPDRGGGDDSGALIKQHQLLEPDVADLTTVSQYQFRCCQGHFAVSSTRIGRDVVDPVIGKPRQLRGADIALPGVPFGLLGQPDVLTQQGVHRRGGPTARRVVPGCRLEKEAAMGPGRQRRIHQASTRKQSGEIDRSTDAVQIGEEPPQTIRLWLVTSHGGNGVDRDTGRVRGLLDGAHQQRMRSRFGENAHAVLQCGLYRRCEPHRLPEVVDPVAGVEGGPGARILQGR